MILLIGAFLVNVFTDVDFDLLAGAIGQLNQVNPFLVNVLGPGVPGSWVKLKLSLFKTVWIGSGGRVRQRRQSRFAEKRELLGGTKEDSVSLTRGH